MGKERGSVMRITHEIQIITPEIAEKWLRENNTHNRSLYEHTVNHYAREMSSGAWTITNQGIGFAEDGTLLDGQHRLAAVVKAGIPIQMLVINNLPKMYKNNGDGPLFTQDVVDVVKPRSNPDILKLSHNMDYANIKMAIANMIIYSFRSTTVKISARVGYKIIDLYSDEIEFTLSNRSQIKGLSYTPAITGIVLAAKVDLDRAMEFKDQYFKGLDLSIGSPSLTFRNYILSRTKTGAQGSGVRSTIHNYSLTALKYHFDGKPLHRLIASDRHKEYFLSKQKTCVNMVLDWSK